MSRLSTLGATIFPPVASFYTRPQSIEQMVDTTLMRVLDQFDIDLATGPRWTGR
jgi:4-hydroxy-3-polyprenylbenzoate decarboxylase